MWKKTGLTLRLTILLTGLLLLSAGCTPKSASFNKVFKLHGGKSSRSASNNTDPAKPIYYRDKAVVLLYHDVTAVECGTAITPERFASHMRMLAENGFSVVSLNDITAFAEKGTPLPNNAVAITLDDACASNYQTVLPALQARKWPFTVFVTVSELGRTRPNGLRRLSWPELKEMSRAGILVGSHTYNGHIKWQNQQGHKACWLTEHFKNESEQQYQVRVLKDLKDSRQTLEQELGLPVLHFAHPFGAYTETSVQLAQQAGYKYIWTTHPVPVQRNSSLSALGRVSVGIKGTSAEQLKAAILKVANSN